MVNLSKLKKHDIRPKGDPRPDEPRWEYVNGDNQTTGKDEFSNYIYEEILEKGRWPMDVIYIAEEVDYSRQHVTNCLLDYFEIVPKDEGSTASEDGGQTPIMPDVEPPESIENEVDYWKGVVQGMWVANSQRK